MNSGTALKPLSVSLALALAFFFVPLVAVPGVAQQPGQGSAASPVPDPPSARPVPSRFPATPFPPGEGPLEIARSIRLLSPEQMTEAGRMLEADAESSIAERAGFNDIAFNQGKWGYEQLVCPALPHHLFLRFTRNNGTHDVSVFSVSIPRNGQGRLRVIPILRRSYSLFSPAPINAMTIAAFNHIRTEEQAESTPSWLGTALCYAALAGANPLAAHESMTDGPKVFPAASAPELEIPPQGGAIVRFTDMAAAPRPMVWNLIFNRKGRILKATHAPADLNAERPVPMNTAEQRARPVPAS
jgi:hypothetical protein